MCVWDCCLGAKSAIVRGASASDMVSAAACKYSCKCSFILNSTLGTWRLPFICRSMAKHACCGSKCSETRLPSGAYCHTVISSAFPGAEEEVPCAADRRLGVKKGFGAGVTGEEGGSGLAAAATGSEPASGLGAAGTVSELGAGSTRGLFATGVETGAGMMGDVAKGAGARN